MVIVGLVVVQEAKESIWFDYAHVLPRPLHRLCAWGEQNMRTEFIS